MQFHWTGFDAAADRSDAWSDRHIIQEELKWNHAWSDSVSFGWSVNPAGGHTLFFFLKWCPFHRSPCRIKKTWLRLQKSTCLMLTFFSEISVSMKIMLPISSTRSGCTGKYGCYTPGFLWVSIWFLSASFSFPVSLCRSKIFPINSFEYPQNPTGGRCPHRL